MMLGDVIPVLMEEDAAPEETQEAPAEPQEVKEPQTATETVQATEENLLDNQNEDLANSLKFAQ